MMAVDEKSPIRNGRDYSECRRIYAAARSRCAAESRNKPSPVLQKVHKSPLTFPVLWQWSMWNALPRGGVWQIKQRPFWLVAIRRYCSSVMLYFLNLATFRFAWLNFFLQAMQRWPRLFLSPPQSRHTLATIRLFRRNRALSFITSAHGLHICFVPVSPLSFRHTRQRPAATFLRSCRACLARQVMQVFGVRFCLRLMRPATVRRKSFSGFTQPQLVQDFSVTICSVTACSPLMRMCLARLGWVS